LAEVICESNNAALISIHSTEENEFIRNYVEQSSPSAKIDIWIGLKRDISFSNEFVWVDKSPVDYYNWGFRAGSNISKLYTVMQIYKRGLWKDLDHDDDNTFPFVCGFNCKISNKSSI